jgi:dienelactone hydrolase
MSSLRPHAYDCDGTTLTGLMALPSADGPRPAVLVMHPGFGIGELVRKRTEDLAAAGYVAFASDMYGFQGDEQKGKAAYGALQTDPHLLRSRVVAAYETVRALPQVDASRISAIGFCFGGQCVLELARSGLDVASVVSFHGVLRTQLPAERGAVKAKILAITGLKDPYAPAAEVEAFRKEMTDAEANWQMTLYSNGWHAFTDPVTGSRADVPGVRYDPLLARLSWAQSSDFLEATLAQD